MTEQELYDWVNSHIPASVDRQFATQNLNAGEVELAFIDLISEAAYDGVLPSDVVDALRQEYPTGVLRDVLDSVVIENAA